MLEKNSDSEVHVEKVEQRPTASIAFGLERLGLIAMQAPILSCIVLVGADRRRDLRHRAHQDRRFAEPAVPLQFQGIPAIRGGDQALPGDEFDVLVVVEGKTLLERDNLEKLRDLVTDLQLVDGTRGLISLFSARQAPAPGKLPAALFPAELPQGADYDKFIETVKTNEIIRGKLLSEDGTLALIVLSLDPDVVASNKLDQDDRRYPQDDDRGSRRHRAQRGTVRRAGHAARNPQRGRARRADLQRPRHPGRLHHRDHLLPQDIVHDRRRVPAASSRSCWRSAASAGPISASTCS